MTIQTVTITGVSTPQEVYGGLQAAKDYLAAGVTAGALAFAALATDSDRGRYLRQATLWIDRQAWAGAPTVPAVGGTALKWPRTGVTEPDKTTTDPNVVPPDIVSATFEAVALILADTSAPANADQGSNVKALKAGSVSIDYWIPTSVTNGTATILPTVIDQLVGRYLNAFGDATAIGGLWSGASDDDPDDNPSPFSTDSQFRRANTF